MKLRYQERRATLSGLLCSALALAGCSFGGAGVEGESAAGGDLNPNTSITVVPVVLMARPNRDVADVLGMMLEQEGMPDVWTTERNFTPSPDGGMDLLVDEFSEFVREEPFETECALLTQVIGDQTTGIREVRTVLSDAKGVVLWSSQQTANDRAFRRANPVNPMACCVLVRDLLRSPFHLTSKTRGTAKEKRMERLVMGKSGRPSETELRSMKSRAEKMKKSGSGSIFHIFSVQTAGGFNPNQAIELAEAIQKKVKIKTIVGEGPLTLESEGGSNQQKWVWDLARGLQEHVRKVRPDADYSLVAQFVIRPDNEKVFGVNFVVCDREGEWVLVDFQNSHHSDFKALDPGSERDCSQLVARRLAGYLR